MEEKSHKGCGLCDREKRVYNGAERRPARDLRQIDRMTADRGVATAGQAERQSG